ncbi:MAG: hypothetical protein F6K32_05580 [Desertifilum sp. SIO1I2]|nr:hypothetical protein [Desertifilum sp. SIO1I2]
MLVAPGDCPIPCLNALLKDASDSYPTEMATALNGMRCDPAERSPLAYQ